MGKSRAIYPKPQRRASAAVRPFSDGLPKGGINNVRTCIRTGRRHIGRINLQTKGSGRRFRQPERIMNTVFTPTHLESKLQSDWLYLHETLPPAKWGALPSFGAAASWLGMHHSLRRGQGELDYLNREYLNRRLEWEAYRSRLLKAAELHYGHLHGHHRVEDVHYFPKFRRLEPKLAQGFDVLDRDHEHINRQLHTIEPLLATLTRRETADPALAEQLAAAIESGGEWLYRHLADEEDLVIPILALHA